MSLSLSIKKDENVNFRIEFVNAQIDQFIRRSLKVMSKKNQTQKPYPNPHIIR